MIWLISRSQQIREPIYSMKYSRLRRRRITRYAVIYFLMLLLTVGLILGTMLAGKYIPNSINDIFSDLAGFRLLQPDDLHNNNTNGTQQTGTGMPGYTGVGRHSTTSGSTTAVESKIKLF